MLTTTVSASDGYTPRKSHQFRDAFRSKRFRYQPMMGGSSAGLHSFEQDSYPEFVPRPFSYRNMPSSMAANRGPQNWIHYYYNHPLISGGIGEFQRDMEKAEHSPKENPNLETGLAKDLMQSDDYISTRNGGFKITHSRPGQGGNGNTASPHRLPHNMQFSRPFPRPPSVSRPPTVFHPVLLTRPILVTNPIPIAPTEDSYIYYNDKGPILLHEKEPLLDQQELQEAEAEAEDVDVDGLVVSQPQDAALTALRQQQPPFKADYHVSWYPDSQLLQLKDDTNDANDLMTDVWDANRLREFLERVDSNGSNEDFRVDSSETNDVADIAETIEPHELTFSKDQNSLRNTQPAKSMPLLRASPLAKFHIFGK